MGINVLSLFDGMSCGQIALDRLGVEVDTYFASEIDKYAIQIAKKNYPNTKHNGDVRNIKPWIMPPIDLLMGGSPCQGFSFAGKQLNFEDPRSKLFFEFARVLDEARPKYFLLENVLMSKKSEDVITEMLGVHPIEINSALVSAQNRRRLYWTNIPILDFPEDRNIKDKRLLRWSRSTRYPKDGPSYVESRFYSDGKSNTLLTGKGCSTFSSKTKIVDDKCNLRDLTPLECERLQTVPDNYTEGVSDTQRYKMLGNGWTVDVICHILKNMELGERNE